MVIILMRRLRAIRMGNCFSDGSNYLLIQIDHCKYNKWKVCSWSWHHEEIEAIRNDVLKCMQTFGLLSLVELIDMLNSWNTAQINGISPRIYYVQCVQNKFISMKL